MSPDESVSSPRYSSRISLVLSFLLANLVFSHHKVPTCTMRLQ